MVIVGAGAAGVACRSSTGKVSRVTTSKKGFTSYNSAHPASARRHLMNTHLGVDHVYPHYPDLTLHCIEGVQCPGRVVAIAKEE